MEYRKEIKSLVKWCRDNNFSNVSKYKELVIDFRKWDRVQSAVCIRGVDVEMVE